MPKLLLNHVDWTSAKQGMHRFQGGKASYFTFNQNQLNPKLMAETYAVDVPWSVSPFISTKHACWALTSEPYNGGLCLRLRISRLSRKPWRGHTTGFWYKRQCVLLVGKRFGWMEVCRLNSDSTGWRPLRPWRGGGGATLDEFLLDWGEVGSAPFLILT
jgi:hypothetical protein